MLWPPALEETVTEPLDPVALVFGFIASAYVPVFELKEDAIIFTNGITPVLLLLNRLPYFQIATYANAVTLQTNNNPATNN